jgi:hypothetical protein
MIRVSCEEVFGYDPLLDEQEEFYVVNEGDDDCNLFVVLDGKGNAHFSSRNRRIAEKKCNELNNENR